MMTTEDRLDKLEEKYSNLHTVINVLAQEMQDFKQEMKDFRQEIRDRDNRRAAEAEEIRNEIREINRATDEKIADIRNYSRSQTLVTLLGIGAMVVAVLLK